MKKYYPIVIIGIIAVIIMAFSMTGVINEKIGMSIALSLVILLNIVVAVIASKNDVKLVGIVMALCSLVGVALLGINIYSIFDRDPEDVSFQVTAKENTSPKSKLFSLDGKNYYTYNLSEVNIVMTKSKNEYTLEKALKDGYVKLDDILNLSIPNDSTEGYKVYYDGGGSGIPDDSYSITVCENETDIIFSGFNYSYSEDICND